MSFCILSWAVKEKALTKELAGAIFEAVDLAGGFDNRVYELLTAAYEICGGRVCRHHMQLPD